MQWGDLEVHPKEGWDEGQHPSARGLVMVYHDLGMLGAYKQTLWFFFFSLSPHLGPAGMRRFFQTLGEQKQDWTEKQLEDALREQSAS